MLILHTPAKVNLFLNLLGLRQDGFHEVCFVMQTVALWDTLSITPWLGKRDALKLTCNRPELIDDPEQNSVVRAYHRFWEATGLPPLGLEAHLEKRIPVQAGLGGGSSDAAAMLVALNHLSFANLTIGELTPIAASLGSDVPFFLHGGTALASGRGDEIQPLPHRMPRLSMIVVKPRLLSISTQEAYRLVRERGEYAVKPVEPFLERLARVKYTTDAPKIEPFLHNDFEEALWEHYPSLADTAERLRRCGVIRPLLCGSGSAIMGFLPPTPTHRQAIGHAFPMAEYEVFWTRTQADALHQSVSMTPAV